MRMINKNTCINILTNNTIMSTINRQCSMNMKVLKV